ncbi:MAG: NAD-dependent epimerase/dehydratase [Rickettsiaceae bacterium]|jgi:nucleoside-diphosphate-sugar epimerase|nr:NAD-dependent epimerase/dehydratase [Rickettsiaceae bacterium]
MTKKILVTGAIGQIGSELLTELRKKYGAQNVIASDIRSPKPEESEFEPFELLDVLDKRGIENIVKKHQINVIYHLSAILSAAGEKNPHLCWDVNMNGLHNILEIAREFGIKQVMCPSSIAVFGPETPRQNTPQETVLLPKTMYGVTKVAGELLCEYYVTKFGLDVRGIRYPGLISSKTLPGGGTTDYAVEIFYEAIKHKKYSCFLQADTVLPMMYLPDAIRGTIELSEADFSSLKHHCNFNFAGMSFSCAEIAAEIKKHIPEFEIEYKPDFRQKIADSWPQSIDDSSSRNEWGWKPQYNLERMVEDMIEKLTLKLAAK